MNWTCSACGQPFHHSVGGRPVIRAYVDLGGRTVTFDPWAVDDPSPGRRVLEAREEAPAGTPAIGRLVRWRLEKRGPETVSCAEYLASPEEVRRAFGPHVATRFFGTGVEAREITVEMPLPVPEDLAGIIERMALLAVEG